MSVNNFLPFCQTDSGTNLESQADYTIDAQRTQGNQPGVARSKLVNKALRQATAVMNVLADIVMDRVAADVLDDGNLTTLKAQFQTAFPVVTPLVPVFRSILSGSGTYGLSRAFFVSSANATAGATYTNNAVTFTVLQTIAGATLLYAAGAGTPTSSGTLTKSGGTGDTTITFSSFKTPLYLKVKAAAGGGGGAGGNTSGTGTGGTGGTTTFGSSLLTCVGGSGGTPPNNGFGGAGGTATIASPATGKAWPGIIGGGSAIQLTTGNVFPAGGNGGGSVLFGGGGSMSTSSETPKVGLANTGGGGSGAGLNISAGNTAGGGGGGGGSLEAIIPNPSSSYAYAVGAGGTGGALGTNAGVGADGGSGCILIEEHYQ